MSKAERTFPQPSNNQSALNAILRSDFVSFIRKCFYTINPGVQYVDGFHIEAIAYHLEQCLQGNENRLAISIQPRSLKSLVVSAAFPAWVLGHDPTRKILCVSYSQELAAKHARDCRIVMVSDWYRRLFPHTKISREKNTETEFMTTKRGGRMAVSVGGSLTGRGGNMIIVDDPMKAEDAQSRTARESANSWFGTTLYSRLDNKENDIIIVVMQRLHLDDLIGHITSNSAWSHLKLQSIAEMKERIQIGTDQWYTREAGQILQPNREPQNVLDDIKANIGSFQFSAQYQQEPLPIDGNLIKWDWFRSYKELPPFVGDDVVVQSWDTASKSTELSDYSVCTIWFVKKDKFYLLDVFRKKMDFPELKKEAIRLSNKYKRVKILIEDKGSGTSLIQELRGHKIYAKAISPEGDKVTRMSAQSSKIEAGQVFIDPNADYIKEFRNEFLQFPGGRYDDQVDSVSQFLGWIEQRRRGRVVVVRTC